MPAFEKILIADQEELVDMFSSVGPGIANIAATFSIDPTQLICALGFNANLTQLVPIITNLGYEKFDDLVQDRNRIYVSDLYKKIPLENIFALYHQVKNEREILEIMQYLLRKRINNIEEFIDKTVNSTLITNYKKEMDAIYVDGIASLDFAEERLNSVENGFRALINEVCIIAKSHFIPIGDIFFRDTILLEERRNLLNKHLVPAKIVQERLQDKTISLDERRILSDFLALPNKYEQKS